MAEFSHYSVMLNECIDGLNIRPDGLYLDCTAGGGGHSLEIVRRLGEGGKLIAIDQDAAAIEAVKKRLAGYEDRFETVHENFRSVKAILNGRKADGAIIDLGVSSYQLDTPERGFSYLHDAPLDMRMNPEAEITAYDVINGWSEKELSQIFFNYGEEKFANRIAAAICRKRAEAPIETTLALAEIVRSALPGMSFSDTAHPEKRVFQAVRIEVNHELEIIPPTVKDLISCLKPGGRLVILTFHSLEDREVKNAFAEAAKGCTCPPSFPVCVCGKTPDIRIITKKPLLPSEKELSENVRSHSAKLRIAEKL